MGENLKYRQPQFLEGSHEPIHRLRCPIHGFIRYSDSERKIIDHPLFRRLRYIRQLALTELVYPGATHTRFEHSLGVMEMATRIFDQLASREGAVMEATFKEIPGLSENTMARARQICRLAGLLHDIGHCCFSHAAEDVLHEDSSHEGLAVTVLTEDEYLKKELEKFFPECASLTASLISNPAPQLQILHEIISGQIDADRTDYLLRDSYHCGVDYGRFDFRRLIECLTVWKNESSGALEMAINHDGIHSFESLILARYQMNTQVYFHRLRRIYDLYLKNYFSSLGKSTFDTDDKVLALNDFKAIVELMDAAKDQEHSGHQWAKRIMERNHHRDVFSLDEGDGHLDLKKARQVFDAVREKFPRTDFLEDLPEKGISIHKVARSSDQDDSNIDFPVIDRGERSSLGERSQILEKLPASFRVGFIFADVTDRKEKQEIADFCQTTYRNL